MALSWNTKIITIFILVLSGTLIIQVFYIIPFIQDEKENSAKTYQEEVALNIAREIDIDLNRLTNLLYIIAEEAPFQNMNISDQTEVLFQYSNLSLDISYLFVMNETGWFVSGTAEEMDVYYKASYSYWDAFRIPFEQGDEFFGQPLYYFNDTVIATFVSIPIESSIGEHLGVLFGTMIINDLVNRINTYPLKEDQVVFLVTEFGTVIANSDIDLLSLEAGPLSLNYSSHPLVQELIESNSSSDLEVTHSYKINETSYHGVHKALESNGWGVIVETPRSTILSETSGLTLDLLLINVFLFGSALIIAVTYTQQITSIQKRSEKLLQEAQESLIKKEKLAVLGQLAGGIGHELRNPLSAINNATYFLNMALEEPDSEIAESLSIIQTEILKSEKIITSLLSYARPKPLLLKKTDLNNVIQQSLASIDIPDNFKILNEMNNTTPSIKADPDQLVQVFSNLISNAVQATPGDGQVTIKSKTLNKDWITISITDNGAGISLENLEKLFTPLFTTKAKGIGLGLVITKTIIDAHKGTIEIESEVGKGSTFEVKLPTHN